MLCSIHVAQYTPLIARPNRKRYHKYVDFGRHRHGHLRGRTEGETTRPRLQLIAINLTTAVPSMSPLDPYFAL